MIKSNSQSEFQKLRNQKFLKFSQAKTSCEILNPRVTAYDNPAIIEVFNKFKNYRVPIRHEDYEPDPSHFQYDMEMYLFLHFDEILHRAKELDDKLIKILDKQKAEGDIKKYGAALMTREEHLMNAMSIRWPERILPNGQIAGTIVRTPWLEDFFYGVGNYDDTIMFGGAGQGKTYGPLAFMTMAFDHFIDTKAGAQCSFSTVSGAKMESSSWPLLNKLQSFRNKYPISLYAGKAVKSTDYTYKRVNDKGKYIEEGGMFRGVLLAAGRKDARVIDKLTGSHDPVCKIYLLDEMQSTDSAPLDAYPNIFLHPKYQWFFGSGNYEKDGDLLSVNAEPNEGWEKVNQNTHMWEGTLKSLIQDLGKTSLVIHYNNELSPAMTSPEIARKYSKFMPTPEKKEKLYPTEEQKESYGYKRFWIGFRFEKEEAANEKIITADIIKETGSDKPIDFRPLVMIGSFDSAAASIDGNTFTSFAIGLDKDDFPMICPNRITTFPKPSSALLYYKETAERIKETMSEDGVESNHLIMDWTNRTALLEKLGEMGIICHHIIYNQIPPDKVQQNEVTGAKEEPIMLNVVPTLAGMFERNTYVWAHEFIGDRISLGAYLFRMFVENGRFRGINSSLLEGKGYKSFEKEFLSRSFINGKKRYSASRSHIITVDSKEEFKKKYKFSPDILDTFFQACYMLRVIFKVEPNKKGLGLLTRKREDKKKDNMKKLWEGRSQQF